MSKENHGCFAIDIIFMLAYFAFVVWLFTHMIGDFYLQIVAGAK